MARQRVSNPRKLRKYSKIINETVVSALVRGGTDHRVDLILEHGGVVSLYKDGTVERH